MNEPMQAAPMPETPKKSNSGLIIAIIVVVVLCICCVVVGGGYYLYQNGDKIFNTGASSWLMQVL